MRDENGQSENGEREKPARLDTAVNSAEQVGKTVRALLITSLLACVYCLLTIWSTTDAKIYTNSRTTPVPIIGTQIAIGVVTFYFWAPVILIVLYVYFHFILQRFWESVARLPAMFGIDNEELERTVAPWPLSGFIRLHLKPLRKHLEDKGQQPAFFWQERWAFAILTWGAVPLTVLCFWFRYVRVHDWLVTCWHIVLFGVSMWSSVTFYRRGRATLKQPGKERKWSKRIPEPFRAIVAMLLALLWSIVYSILLWPLSFVVIEGRVHEISEKWDFDFDLKTIWKERDICGVFKKSVAWIAWRALPDLRDTDVSLRPANWTGLGENRRTEVAGVKRTLFANKDLRFARALYAFLVRADLHKSRLDKADLEQAQLDAAFLYAAELVDANLSDARLDGADLHDADLTSAILARTVLKKANLRKAILTSATLIRADFQKADLTSAKLIGADLTEADLTSATVSNVDLTGADLRGAKLKGIIGWKEVRSFKDANIYGVKGLSPENREYAIKRGAVEIDSDD